MGAVSVLDPHAARAVFDAACAMAWADGDLVEPELRAIRGLALALGLADLVEATDSALLARQELPTEWRLARLDRSARVLCVAVAAWIAIVDEALDVRELSTLEELAERLGVGPETARVATAHAAWSHSQTRGTPEHRAATLLLVEGARRHVLLADKSAA